VAWKRSGGPHRIRADRLRSHLSVVPRAQNDPLRFRWWPMVFDGMPLRATAACHDLAGGEVSLCLGDWSPHDSLTGLPWGCWLEGTHTKGDGRRGEVSAGVGAATATWRRCWRLLPVRERANVCATTCVRQRARTVSTMARVEVSGRLGAIRDRASRRGTQRSPARCHGRRRARLPRSVRAMARGFTAVVGCVQGDRGHGVPFSWRPRA
jgi:hypothetical protein